MELRKYPWNNSESNFMLISDPEIEPYVKLSRYMPWWHMGREEV
jgi:hypothetical protein